MYTGKTYNVPFHRGGLHHTKNIDLIPAEAFVHPSRNINLHQGGRGKRGGTAQVNGAAISGTPRIWGVYQFRLKDGSTFIITATGDGKIQKDYSTVLKTGLTINQAVHFETYNNTLYICTGSNIVQTWDGSAGSTSDISNPNTDWAGAVGQPNIILKHGRGVSERLWAFKCSSNPNKVYASANGSDNFTAASGLVFNIETGDSWGVIGGVEFGDRLILFGKRHPYLIEDSSPNTDLWGYSKAQWGGGVGNHRLIVEIPNDIICFTEEGDIYSVTAAQSYGDYKLASFSKPAFINEWIKEYIKLSAIEDFHAVYDPNLRAIKFFIMRNGITHIDTALLFFIDRGAEEGWVPHDNQSADSGYKASSSTLVRVGAGDYKVYTGGWTDGFVWKLEESDKNDNGNGYYAGFKTARLAFDNVRVTKRYDNGWLVTEPKGNYNVFINWWIDGVAQTQRSIDLSGTGSILPFTLPGTLGGQELIEKIFDLGNIGKRLEFEIFNNNANEDFFLSNMMIDHQPLGALIS